MSVTDYLMGLDPSLKREDEPLGFHHFNTGGVECEVGEFLYGLARATQAKSILETGTHLGISAMYWAKALKDNGGGKLTTIEYERLNYEAASAQLRRVGLRDLVDMKLMDARLFYPADVNTEYDIFLSDTEPDLRFEEVVRLFPYVKPGGFIIIHDLHRHMSQVENKALGYGWPYGKLPGQIELWVKWGVLMPMHLPTYRGFTMFYKKHEGDHKWT